MRALSIAIYSYSDRTQCAFSTAAVSSRRVTTKPGFCTRLHVVYFSRSVFVFVMQQV